jgi:general secretion pathway protein D
MEKIIITLVLLAVVGPARAQQAPLVPQAPEAEPIVLRRGAVMQGIDLDTLLEEYSELTGKTVIQGLNLPKVTFNFSTKNDFTRSEAKTFYETLMSTRGIAIVEVNSKVVQAIPSAEVVKSPPPITVLNKEDLPQGDVYINYVHKLRYVKASETVDLLVAFAKSPQAVTAVESTGTIVLRDFSNNVRRMLDMLEYIDVEEINDQEIAVVKIKYALSADIAQVISSYTANPTSRGSTANTRPGSTSSSSSRTPSSSSRMGSSSTRRYDSGLQPATTSTRSSSSGSTSSRGSLQQRLSQVVQGAGVSGTGAAILGETSIISWERGNEVIIVGNPAQVLQAKALIEKLDRVQPQVLIESIIMDVALGDDATFGVSIREQQEGIGNDSGAANSGGFASSLASAFGPAAFATNAVNGATSGFNYWGKFGLNWEVALEAINNDTRVEILSRPRIQTTHASQADLFIGDTRPVVTGSIRDINGGTSSQYQMQQIGITLEVLPFINDEGVVSMEIVQQIQDIVGSQIIDGNAVPITTDRSANAKVNVRDGEMVVLGGFIKTKVTESESSVPVLSDVPLLGALFRRTVDVNERNELIVMMRPTVLATPEAAYSKALSELEGKPGLKAAQFNERLLTRKWEVNLDEDRKRKEKIMRERHGIDLKESDVKPLEEPRRLNGLDQLRRQQP